MSTREPGTGQVPGRSAQALDDVAYEILGVLREHGRISIAALAERVGISRASAYARVEALTRDGVITGFSARVDPGRAGLAICALVFVTIHPQAWGVFRAALAEMPEVEYCAITTGEHDAMLLVRATDVAGIHDFATGVVAQVPAVKAVVSVVVLDEVIRLPYVLPTDVPARPDIARLGMTRWTPAAAGRDGFPPRGA
ncbi:Lrp/AsnC family transcriptional regulator [Agromyces archimandritae]|uniref:Lrp/AsnC family transcriptional regulator n=1 Tax=Agromyces archimandritae TaxID=2781962 RepID=A0A975IN31_9MICO|nr:Lrp/AsnC family transcriptional regulator [Agromyces archimandritae]QTX03814.1 Lrp/AsnC family transcriptional regulator [Agromyces archimandritae]